MQQKDCFYRLNTFLHGKYIAIKFGNEIPKMHRNVSIGQPGKPPMLTVGVGEVKNINSVGQCVFLHPYNGLYIDSSHQSNSLHPLSCCH